MNIKACNNWKNLLKVNTNKYICKILKTDVNEIDKCIFKEEI